MGFDASQHFEYKGVADIKVRAEDRLSTQPFDHTDFGNGLSYVLIFCFHGCHSKMPEAGKRESLEVKNIFKLPGIP